LVINIQSIHDAQSERTSGLEYETTRLSRKVEFDFQVTRTRKPQ